MNRVSKLVCQLKPCSSSAPKIDALEDNKHREVMECIRRLVLEHKRMQKTLSCFENMLSKQEFPMSDVKDFLHFFRVFGDVLHHAKEEDVLFSKMPKTRPIDKLMRHHVRLRYLTNKVLQCATNNDIEGVRHYGVEQIYTLRSHIQTENHMLWTLMMNFENQHHDIMHGIYERFMAIDKKNETEAKGLIAVSNRLIKKWAPKKFRQYKMPQVANIHPQSKK